MMAPLQTVLNRHVVPAAVNVSGEAEVAVRRLRDAADELGRAMKAHPRHAAAAAGLVGLVLAWAIRRRAFSKR